MNAAQVDCQHNSATRASSGGLLEAFALMYGSFNRSRSLLWAAAAPVAASLTAAVLALDTCTPSNTAGVGVAAALRRYTSPINLDTAFNGMLLGRGDPKTRKGKIKRKSYGKCRPRYKTDWKEWSESQLASMPERKIPIPWPPAAKRSQVVPFPEVVITDADRQLAREWASSISDQQSHPPGHSDEAENQPSDGRH